MTDENTKALKEMLEAYNETPAAGALTDMILISIATSLAVIADAMAEPYDSCEVGNPCLYCKHEF